LTVTPPNLQKLFGTEYLIGHDPAAETYEEKKDPWAMQIHCRGQGVTIYPYAHDSLAIQCDNRPFIANKLAELGLSIQQDGDREKTFLFSVSMFAEVAKIVKPHRRRSLSDQQRADKATQMKAINADKIGPFEPEFASGPPIGAF